MTIELNEESHIYTVDGVEKPSVTQILDLLSYDTYGQIDKGTLEYAARRGSDIHEATQDLDLGLPCEVDGETYPYLSAYCDFTRDYYGISHHMIEQPIYDEEYDYCGTVDRLSKVGSQLWLIDIKTVGSPNRLTYIKLCLQTWMYAHALQTDCRRYGLFLKKDGSYRLFDCKEWETKNGIVPKEIVPQLVDAYKLIQTLKTKKVKGEKNGRTSVAD